MTMDTAAVEQLLDEMLSSLEALETKAAATLQFLKDKGHATDKDLAPYLEQAGNASNVRWRAARLRMMSLLSSALKNVEEPKKKPKAPREAAKTTAAPEPEAAQASDKPESVSEEILAELAHATRGEPSADEQSTDVGKEPKPDSTEHKNTEHPAAETKAPTNLAQPDDETTKSAQPPEKSDLNRKTEHPAASITKEDAA